MKRRTFLSLMGAAALTSSMMLTGCGAGPDDDRKIVRIGHVQSQTHPDHLGLEAFSNYILMYYMAIIAGLLLVTFIPAMSTALPQAMGLL